VPTLAVTAEERPRLLINLGFVRQHCVRRSTSRPRCATSSCTCCSGTRRCKKADTSQALALERVINAIIHRQLGEKYSDLMATYYRDAQGLMVLLRPMTQRECGGPPWWQAGSAVQGTVLADDIEQLAQDLGGKAAHTDSGHRPPARHHAADEPLPDACSTRSSVRAAR